MASDLIVTKRARVDDSPSALSQAPLAPLRRELHNRVPDAVWTSIIGLLDFKERDSLGRTCKNYQTAVIRCGNQELSFIQRDLSMVVTALRTNSALTGFANAIEAILSRDPPRRGLNNPLLPYQRRMLGVMGCIHDIFIGRPGVVHTAPTPYTQALHQSFKAELVGAINEWKVIRLFLQYFGGAAFCLASLGIRSTERYIWEATCFCRRALRHLDPLFVPSPAFERKLIYQASIYHPHLIKHQLEFIAYQIRHYETPSPSSIENERLILLDTRSAVNVPRPLNWKSWPQEPLSDVEMNRTQRLAENIQALYPDWVRLLRADPFIHRASPALQADSSFFADLAKHPCLRLSTLQELPPEQINEQLLDNILQNPFSDDVMLYLIRKMRPGTRTFTMAKAMTDDIQVKFLCLRAKEDNRYYPEAIIKALYPDKFLPPCTVILRAFYSLVEEEQTWQHDNHKCIDLLGGFLSKQFPREETRRVFELILDQYYPYTEEREEEWDKWPTNVASVLNYALQRIPNLPENELFAQDLLEDCLRGRADILKGFLMAQLITPAKKPPETRNTID